MSESKHTPGPWVVENSRHPGSNFKQHIRAGKWAVASTRRGYSVSTDEVDANARLIAAAPELLDLAREAAEVGETIAALACAPDGSYRVPCDATKAELVSIITDLGTKAAALINSATKGEA